MNAIYAVSAILGLASLAFGIYCAVLASQYDDAKWAAVGQNKMLFVIGCPLGAFCCWIVGLALSLWFYFGLKPQLDAA